MNSDDVVRAVTLARDTLTGATDRDWQAPAGTLEWTCWETVEHMTDVFFGYAAQLGPSRPSTTTYVPLGWGFRREGGPGLTVYAEEGASPSGLIENFEACGTILAATIAFVPADRVTFHTYSTSDASGFAAMGVVETLVHTHDAAAGLGVAWAPPADLCASALRRLFPWAPTEGDPWETLLDATGRGPTVRPQWRWDGTPR
jgi:hypothetical protein